VRIESGNTLPEIATHLEEAHVIRSSGAFRLFVRSIGGAHSINAGTYRFMEPETGFTVALRLIFGEYGIPPIRTTFPEGLSVREMSLVVAEQFSQEFADEFLLAAKQYEGYLFPDTYLFSPEDTPDSIIEYMRDNFDERMEEFMPALRASGRTLDEIVTMASLLERETNTVEDAHIISGILWDRVEIGMALQVDAVFGYIFEKSGYAPTFEDLEIDSPYNTYTNRGLPPTPIGNPGRTAIQAALEPRETPYLYYLTGLDGNMYYAETFEGHKANRERYL
jgi:UPF0755 protein